MHGDAPQHLQLQRVVSAGQRFVAGMAAKHVAPPLRLHGASRAQPHTFVASGANVVATIGACVVVVGQPAVSGFEMQYRAGVVFAAQARHAAVSALQQAGAGFSQLPPQPRESVLTSL